MSAHTQRAKSTLHIGILTEDSRIFIRDGGRDFSLRGGRDFIRDGGRGFPLRGGRDFSLPLSFFDFTIDIDERMLYNI